jgi:hypothetical protein
MSAENKFWPQYGDLNPLSKTHTLPENVKNIYASYDSNSSIALENKLARDYLSLSLVDLIKKSESIQKEAEMSLNLPVP